MNDEYKRAPEELQALFESELAIKRKANEEQRSKVNRWALGTGLACGHFASFVPRLPMNPTVRPFLFTDQKWEVLMLIGGVATLAILGALAGFLFDRSRTELRDFSLAGLGMALMLVLFR